MMGWGPFGRSSVVSPSSGALDGTFSEVQSIFRSNKYRSAAGARDNEWRSAAQGLLDYLRCKYSDFTTVGNFAFTVKAIERVSSRTWPLTLERA